MLILTKGQVQDIVVTLTEKQLLTNPNYLFIFTGMQTKETVAFVLLNTDDESPNKTRFNKFEIDVDDYFANEPVQQYIYTVYEQASSGNTNPTGLNLLETGIMDLRDPETIFTQPNQSTQFIIPNV